MSEAVRPAFTSYQKRLFVFLSVACFFEGYDFFALSQLLPNIGEAFELTRGETARLVGIVNGGTVLALIVVRLADVWGRRRVLMITILGYTLFTLLSGLAPNAFWFGLFQFLARIFLIGEWATSMIVAAEEYPAERRGTVIGVVSAAAGLGSIVCALLVPFLLKTPWGFRSVYFAGVLPLLLLAYARRGLKETARFEARDRRDTPSLMAIWRTPYRRRVIEVGLIWLLCYVCSQNAVMFWKSFAVSERGLTDGQVALAVAISAGISMPVAFAAGRFLDAVGRRVGGSVILLALALGTFLAYSVRGTLLLTISLAIATIGATTMLTVLNTITTELFPTEHRGAAFAWTNNLIGRIGYWLSPILLESTFDVYGWANGIRPTVIGPLLAVVLIWVLLPETRGQELEKSAELRA